ncbi:MAG: asparagine--tRNA ligase [Deltaproteobacteria bacterium]|nr:MAG: asparagine--tRNA ligase [Deltaproteobacteria bacterium]
MTEICYITEYINKEVEIRGWVYNKRETSNIVFINIRDGTGVIQVLFLKERFTTIQVNQILSLLVESVISIKGFVRIEKKAPYKEVEVHASLYSILFENTVEFPISKKDHSDGFLMKYRHLWLRSSRQHLILKIRSAVINAVREYFEVNNFTLVDSPIFTASSCEETSTLFNTKWVNNESVYLSQSGQLYQEAACMAFRKTYCFGPVFRAEKSKTRRHLNEFWMVEPEMAFADLDRIIEVAEELICFTVSKVLEKHEKDLSDILERELTILKMLRRPFVRMTYVDAKHKLELLMNKQLEGDFGAPQETELSFMHDRPIVVTHYPAQVKPFYMKRDESDVRFVKCMDILAPEGYGEIIGGSQREEDYESLKKNILNTGLNEYDFSWYLDLRQYGTVVHSGFGMGIERLVAWICGLHHLREAIPFARTIERIRP